jgi:gliding motility-associated-like protein
VYIDFLYTLFVPNAFSPNDIPPNDVFKPEGLGHINYELIIYDRWGGTIYKEANGAWDGSSEGKVVPDGVYPYLIILKDYNDKNHYHKGIIHLLR